MKPAGYDHRIRIFSDDTIADKRGIVALRAVEQMALQTGDDLVGEFDFPSASGRRAEREDAEIDAGHP
jgi:hypothetical protein